MEQYIFCRAIDEAITKLKARHKTHIAVYGRDNERRLTGRHETANVSLTMNSSNRTELHKIHSNILDQSIQCWYCQPWCICSNSTSSRRRKMRLLRRSTTSFELWSVRCYWYYCSNSLSRRKGFGRESLNNKSSCHEIRLNRTRKWFVNERVKTVFLFNFSLWSNHFNIFSFVEDSPSFNHFWIIFFVLNKLGTNIFQEKLPFQLAW